MKYFKENVIFFIWEDKIVIFIDVEYVFYIIIVFLIWCILMLVIKFVSIFIFFIMVRMCDSRLNFF